MHAPTFDRVYRRGGKLIIEIAEVRFVADATDDVRHRIVDRDAFVAWICENLLDARDSSESGHPRFWALFSQALCAEAAERGAGVIPHDGNAALPIDQSPDLFPDDVTRELLGPHVKESLIVG